MTAIATHQLSPLLYGSLPPGFGRGKRANKTAVPPVSSASGPNDGTGTGDPDRSTPPPAASITRHRATGPDDDAAANRMDDDGAKPHAPSGGPGDDNGNNVPVASSADSGSPKETGGHQTGGKRTS